MVKSIEFLIMLMDVKSGCNRSAHALDLPVPGSNLRMSANHKIAVTVMSFGKHILSFGLRVTTFR